MKTNVMNRMRIRWVGIALVLFTLLGTAAVTQYLIRNEQKAETQGILSKGNYLANLIALYPLNDFQGKNGEVFLRTFREYLFSDKLIYCLIHDDQGRPLFVLAPEGVPTAIPEDIRIRSLLTMGLSTQSFNMGGLNNTVYEFAKPIFAEGRKSGIVRLGFKAPAVEFFSPQRISLLAMIAFFILATGIFVYYGTALALRPLKNLYQSLGISSDPTKESANGAPKTSGLMQVIQDMEQSYFHIKDTLHKNESENAAIAGKLGAATFEKNQISKIIDSIHFGIVITDIHDHVNFINAYMANLLRQNKEALINLPLNEVLTNEELIVFVSHQDVSKTKSSARHLEVEFPEHAPGEMYQVSLSYLMDNSGQVTNKMVLVQNVTQQKSTEKTQHEFIANVAHEFLTPLTTINSYTEMLLEDEISDQKTQKEFFNTINQEVNRLSGIIQNLLNMSKIELGGLTLDIGLVKTDWLVSDSATAVEKNAQEKGITLKKVLPDNFPTIKGDKELLKTAIINLLGNSVKYTPGGGQITFSLSQTEDEVVIEVIDTGHGISEEELPQVFDKFFRSKNPRILEQKGSGLGLAMTYEIIQLHGGKIEVQSELGKGTHFTARLPLEEIYLGQ